MAFNGKQLLTKLVVLMSVSLVASASAYPVQCTYSRESPIGYFSLCQVISNPLPFQYEIIITFKVDYEWKGLSDLRFAYHNPDKTLITANCQTAAPFPNRYEKGQTIAFSQICHSFTPMLQKGADLGVEVFMAGAPPGKSMLLFFPIPSNQNSLTKEEIVQDQNEQFQEKLE